MEGATYISCTNAKVNKFNALRLNEMPAELLEVEAINFHPAIANYKPKIDPKKGTVGCTSFLQCLQFKVGCSVMLIHNIDTLDGLTNGAIGVLEHVVKDNLGAVVKLMIRFKEDFVGKEKRKQKPHLETKYPGCTEIQKVQWEYTIGKDQNRASSKAKVYQFPIIVAFAATTHKFQGQEIAKPNKAALDQKTSFGESMSYVMLSRVPSLEQMYIVGNLDAKKIYPSGKALAELERMVGVSINRNPTSHDARGNIAHVGRWAMARWWCQHLEKSRTPWVLYEP